MAVDIKEPDFPRRVRRPECWAVLRLHGSGQGESASCCPAMRQDNVDRVYWSGTGVVDSWCRPAILQFCNSESLVDGVDLEDTSLGLLSSNCRIARPAPSPGQFYACSLTGGTTLLLPQRCLLRGQTPKQQAAAKAARYARPTRLSRGHRYAVTRISHV